MQNIEIESELKFLARDKIYNKNSMLRVIGDSLTSTHEQGE